MTRGRAGRGVGAVLALRCAVALLTGCGPRLERLDAHVFHDGPGFRLRIVRYHESLPLHFVGDIYVVQCGSPGTAQLPESRTQDAGWRALGRVQGPLEGGSAESAVADARRRYRTLGERTLAWTGIVLEVSTDACASFVRWDPTTLPSGAIEPAPRPDYCAPVGTGDCRYLDFEGDREPVYEDLRATAGGEISFRVRSKAFRSASALRVVTRDGGAHWEVTPEPAGGAPP